MGVGDSAHRRDVGLQVDEPVPGEQEEGGEAEAGQQRPDPRHPQAAAQRQAVARAQGVAAQCLQGMGQAVEGVGGEQQAVEQQGIGRHRGVAEAGTLHGDQQEYALQRQGAQEYVAVDRQQRPPVRPAAQRRPVAATGVFAQSAVSETKAEQGAAPLG